MFLQGAGAQKDSVLIDAAANACVFQAQALRLQSPQGERDEVVSARSKGGRRVIRATRPHPSGKPSPRTGTGSLTLNGSVDLKISGAVDDRQE